MEDALLPFSTPLLPSPFANAPSSPRFRKTDDFPRAVYFSAPTSPARYSTSSASFVPFRGEEDREAKDEDFEFEFSGQLDFARQSAFAEELFGNGSWIRPWKPPLPLQNGGAVPAAGTVSRRRHHEVTHGVRCKITLPVNSGYNPVEAAAATGIGPYGEEDDQEEEKDEAEGQEAPLMHSYHRGRNRKAIQGGSVSRRETRSLPPPRLSDVIFDNSFEDEESVEWREREVKVETRATPYLARLMWVFGNTPGYGYKRWRLRDLLMFRSLSEGTGTGTRDRRSKDDALMRGEEDTVSSSHGGSSQWSWMARDSFRSNEGSTGSTSSRSNRGRQGKAGGANSVELHYTKNRAATEEKKRKTYLPYRQGVLGCLGLGRGFGREMAQGVGCLTRGQ